LLCFHVLSIYYLSDLISGSLGLFSASGTWKEKIFTGESAKYGVSGAGLDIGLLGKYPFDINTQLAVFPLLGITYRSILSAELAGQKVAVPGDYSAIWFKLGGGLDYSFTSDKYLRVGLLYGLRLVNEYEKDMVDKFKAFGASEGIPINAETLLGHGLEIRIGVGYKF
jgi:hypothetical protein